MFVHDISNALATNPTLRRAFARRQSQLPAAIAFWRDTPPSDFLAIRKSIDGDQRENEARRIVGHLTVNSTDVVCLGIAGSSLGGQALAQASYWGTQGYGPQQGQPRLHIVDNLDGATFAKLLSRLDLRTTRFHVVSKSGTTTEPLMHLLMAIEALESAGGGKYLKHHFSGETEPAANPLRSILNEMGAPIIDHDPALGGRFTAFGSVGLVPAILCGLNPALIREGANDVLSASFDPASAPAQGAALSVAARDIGLSQTVLWAYSDRLERLTWWWRQLWAESLGKNGQGTTPISAIGPLDQHSQLQLYLAGPNDKLVTVLDMPASTGPKASVSWASRHGLSLYAGRSAEAVTSAQARATATSLTAQGRAVRRMSLNADLNERNLAGLMMHFVMETLIAARLWDVDAFGQPAVEEGKRLTREYLSGST